MRILLDSCIPTILSKQLNHSVVHGNDIFPPGTTDDVIYAYAKKHKYILVTSNYKDFENTGKFPLKKHPGSIVFNVKNPTKFKYLLDILFIFFSKKSDFLQKRILVKQTKIEIKHRNGKVSELKMNLDQIVSHLLLKDGLLRQMPSELFQHPEGLLQKERLDKLNKIAIIQMKSLTNNSSLKKML